jgi:isopenicillin-N N-acyltransferase-like protein
MNGRRDVSTIQASPDVSTGRTFPFHRFSGTHREIGEQFGESCRDLIHRHRDKVLSRLGEKNGLTREQALDKAMAYRPYVIQYASFFDDEVQGMAAASGLSLPEAYLLQLRAEAATPVLDDDTNECTTFAVQPEATVNGVGLVGQNADLPAFYGEIAITAEIRADDQPAVLMVLPAGQVSYIGINDRGLGVFANFVTCDGWRRGFPRYFLSRLALTEATVDGAIERVRSVRRASSRNLIMLDSHGTAADLETTPTRDARLDPENGLLAHSNHYVHQSLHDEERSPAKNVANSRIRLQQMRDLLDASHGQLDAQRMQAIMRDRTCYPDTLCRMPGDDPDSDTITFASVVAEPGEGRMWVAVGPPNENPYVPLSFSA